MGFTFNGLEEGVGPALQNSVLADTYKILENTDTFGNPKQKVGYGRKSLAYNNVRAHIHLASPVFNHILCRPNDNILGKVFSIDSKLFNDLMTYSYVYSRKEEKFIPVGKVRRADNIITGPQYFRNEIANLDCVERLAELLTKFCKKLVLKKGSLRVTPFDGEYYLFENLYISYDPSVVFKPNKGETEEEVTEFIKRSVFDTAKYPAAKAHSILLSMIVNDNKEFLYSFVPDYVNVIPLGMRPVKDNRHDPLTTLYASVMTANSNCSVIINSNPEPLEVIEKVKELDLAVQTLQQKEVIKRGNKRPKKTIEDRIKGKQGEIRSKGFAKRQDNSGRSTVIIDPFLSIDTIRLPRKMIPELFKYHIMKKFGNEMNLKSIQDLTVDQACELVQKRSKPGVEDSIMDIVCVILGRQPTLHALGMQGFRWEISESDAIEVSPLVVVAFNMDFDGDTGYLKVPCRAKAVDEVMNLMLASRRIYLDKSGSCTIMPRQDIIYGLYVCTKDYPLGESKGDYNDGGMVKDLVVTHKLKVYDTINFKGTLETAGRVAFETCIPNKILVKKVPITKKTIKPIVEAVAKEKTSVFTRTINSMVELGFNVGRIYSPSMNIFTPVEKDDLFEKFHNELESTLEFYELGLESKMTYDVKFHDLVSKLQKEMLKRIKETLGGDNGYVSLAACGARGDDSSLLQIFGFKGLIDRGNGQSFNCLVERSFVDQLTAQDHFITAYGGRDGLINKTLTTAPIGYLSRQLVQAAQHIVIKSEDCGTTEGITIKKRDLIKYYGTVNWYAVEEEFQRRLIKSGLSKEEAIKVQEENIDKVAVEVNGVYKMDILDSKHGVDVSGVNELFEKIIRGRYRIINGKNDIFISNKEAHDIAYNKYTDSIVMRSILTCKCGGCAKCYGEDPGTHSEAPVGLAVGIMAGQAIGESNTQGSLNSFHLGGVVQEKSTRSGFEKVKLLTYGGVVKSTEPSYDFIAWDTGKIDETSRIGISHKKVKIGNSKKSIKIPADVKLKPFALKGTSMRANGGELSVPEIVSSLGLREAQMYLAYMLNAVLSGDDLVFKHYEVIIAACTRHQILMTDRLDLIPGLCCTSEELYRGEVFDSDYSYLTGKLNNTIFNTEIFGVNQVFNKSKQALGKVMMENVGVGLVDCVAYGLNDDLEGPLNRILLGLTPKVGSYYDGFMAAKKRRGI